MTANPIHSGEILRDELDERQLSANRLALDLGVAGSRITGILNGRRAIRADTALRLGQYFGNSAKFWMNLQSAYDLEQANNA
ncbi:MAG TPA: HigA family addiction module antitoxin [Alphaproteobacteria bacterium]|jgi:addiction module HigA family antidote|nr:HigA family addiction module antitoxin [Alphaproteobacteria bacterium]HJM52132.1 HigA family addiction module antitoxin [Alphaproteobacteria bacterium]|tara:strand:+ start:94 stop:339 length:246 start_codon:yes stop_codon:yes gene_type:complete